MNEHFKKYLNINLSFGKRKTFLLIIFGMVKCLYSIKMGQDIQLFIQPYLLSIYCVPGL